jgi:hypothetical protein
MVISKVKTTSGYERGVAYWDEVIWRFVPAQIVGRDLKNFLTTSKDEGIGNSLPVTGYSIQRGSTMTGMGDRFIQFGYLECLFFLLPASLFKTLWQAAQTPDGAFAQLLHIGTITSAMRAVTHQTVDFLRGLIYQTVFIGGLYHYSRLRRCTVAIDKWGRSARELGR